MVFNWKSSLHVILSFVNKWANHEINRVHVNATEMHRVIDYEIDRIIGCTSPCKWSFNIALISVYDQPNLTYRRFDEVRLRKVRYSLRFSAISWLFGFPWITVFVLIIRVFYFGLGSPILISPTQKPRFRNNPHCSKLF